MNCILEMSVVNCNTPVAFFYCTFNSSGVIWLQRFRDYVRECLGDLHFYITNFVLSKRLRWPLNFNNRDHLLLATTNAATFRSYKTTLVPVSLPRFKFSVKICIHHPCDTKYLQSAYYYNWCNIIFSQTL